ncbi:MAG TPA: YlxR family protein [Ktedonobacteraceae bacterium]|nr:YlxR family protein [Ktedonobacteraceae bacterium]
MAQTSNTQPKQSKQPKKPRHIPLRTCVSCQETKSKRELLRVVRTPDGHVVIDATGKKSGRGAYLCARLSCWETAIKKKRLEQEFKQPIPEEDRAGLEAFISTLPKDEPVQPAKTKKQPTAKTP